MEENNIKKISVLVAVYNVEQYIRRCVESVLSQTYSNFELILVDDGSTDSSGVICEEFAQKDVRIMVIRQKNSGAVCARRTCIKNATGDYYVFLDSDDYLEDNALEIIQTSFEKYGCDCVVYGYKKCFASENRVVEVIEPIDSVTPFFTNDRKKFIYDFFVNGARFNPLWRKAVKASVLPKDTDYSPFYHISKANDLIQSLEVYRNINSVSFIDAKPYVYFQNKDGLSQTYNIKRIGHLLIVFNEKYKFLQNEVACLFSSTELFTLKSHCLILPFINCVKIVCGSDNSLFEKREALDQMFESEYFSRANQEYTQQKKFIPLSYRVIMFFFRHRIFCVMSFICMCSKLVTSRQVK